MNNFNSPKSILITGCESGLGLEIVSKLCSLGLPEDIKVIIATCANPRRSTELGELAIKNTRLKIVQLNLLKFDEDYSLFIKSVEVALREAGVNHLTALINRTAVHYNATFDNVDPSQMMEAYRVNAITPLMLTKYLLPFMEIKPNVEGPPPPPKRIIFNIVGGLASITDNTEGNYYCYRPSKMASIMITKSLSINLAEKGILTYSVNIDSLSKNKATLGGASFGSCPPKELSEDEDWPEDEAAARKKTALEENAETSGYSVSDFVSLMLRFLYIPTLTLSGSFINVAGSPTNL